jgi:zinc transporter ZupT
MNATLQIALLALVPVCMLFAGSAALFFSAKTVASFLQLFGAGCLVIVVLTHLSEALRLSNKSFKLPSSSGGFVPERNL